MEEMINLLTKRVLFFKAQLELLDEEHKMNRFKILTEISRAETELGQLPKPMNQSEKTLRGV